MTASLLSAGTAQQVRTRTGFQYVPRVALGVDLVLIVTSVLAAVVGRGVLPFPRTVPSDVVGSQLSVAGPAMILGWVLMIHLLGGYRSQTFGAGLDEYKAVVNGGLITTGFVGIFCYLLRFPLPRGFFVLTFAIGIPLLVLGRFVAATRCPPRPRARRSPAPRDHRWRRGARRRDRQRSAPGDMARLQRGRRPHAREQRPAAPPTPAFRLLGTSKSIAQVALDAHADVVFLAGGAFDSATAMRRLAWELEHEDDPGRHRPERHRRLPRAGAAFARSAGLPLIHLEKPRSEAAARSAKRTFDVLGTLGSAARVQPIFAFAALQIKRHDGGPILFAQKRVGRDGDTLPRA